jgi:uncharacterized protein YggT (Ycf19 family)
MTIPLSETYERQLALEEQAVSPRFLKLARAFVWAVYAVMVVKVVLLLTAFVLRLLGASTDASFTEWVYRSADRSMSPFRGIFAATEVGDSSVLDMSLLFAAVVYLIIALLLDVAVRTLSDKVTARDRRIESLRAAATEAAAREYETERLLAAQQIAAQQAAAAAVAATTQQQQPPAPLV